MDATHLAQQAQRLIDATGLPTLRASELLAITATSLPAARLDHDDADAWAVVRRLASGDLAAVWEVGSAVRATVDGPSGARTYVVVQG